VVTLPRTICFATGVRAQPIDPIPNGAFIPASIVVLPANQGMVHACM
jgi:hypothetical protein